MVVCNGASEKSLATAGQEKVDRVQLSPMKSSWVYDSNCIVETRCHMFGGL